MNKGRKVLDGLFGYVLPPVALLAALLTIWQISVSNLPGWQLPRPTDIFRSMRDDFPQIAPHLLITLKNVLIGFVLAVAIGLTVASIGYFNGAFGKAATPLINLACVIPLVTIVPLLMLWVGFGSAAKIIAVVIQSFPIVNLNAYTAFSNTDKLRLELMQSVRASKVQTLFRCLLPDASPGIFTGIKLSLVFSMTAEITSEIVGGSEGLGAQIIQYTMYMKMPQAFSCIFFVAVLGGVLYQCLNLLERQIVKQ